MHDELPISIVQLKRGWVSGIRAPDGKQNGSGWLEKQRKLHTQVLKC